MSNDLIISTANMPVPDYLREIGGYVDEGLAAGITARAPKLGITIDKGFTVTYEGNVILLQTEMTDNFGKKVVMNAQSVVGVIVAASDTLTKAWYEKAYESGSAEAPDCFSNDGKVPAPGVASPQHSNCAGCPRNAFGSHPVTGRGKACSDRKMIVMVLQSDPDKLLTFNVPTMSLQSLAKLNSDLKSSNIALQSVAVQLSFDQNKTYPVVKIGTVGFVNKEAFLKYKTLAESDEVRSLLREVDYEPAAAESVVPANEVNFGSATSSAPVEQAVVVPQKTAKELAMEKAKADYEAAMAAAAGDDGEQEQTQQTQTTSGGAASDYQAAADAGASAPARRTRRTKAEMEAARAAEDAAKAAVETQSTDVLHAAAVTSNVTQLVQREEPQQTEQAVVQEQSATIEGGPTQSIMALLGKWKSS